MTPDFRFSRHFIDPPDVLACPCCQRFLLEPMRRLCEELEEFRDRCWQAAGREVPVNVDSGYRCETHNAEVGGEPNSQHTRGLAADVRIPAIHLYQALMLAEACPGFCSGGIGLYYNQQGSGFLHLDLRATGPARWAFWLHGDGVRSKTTYGQGVEYVNRMCLAERAGRVSA